MKLKQLGSNQTELEFPSGITLLFSYQTCVAAFIPGKGIQHTSEKHSKTTSKHINTWIKQYSDQVTVSSEPQSYFDFLASNPETKVN